MYCFTCGAKLKKITVTLHTFSNTTGELNTFDYYECPTMKTLGWWKRLWHTT